MPYRSTGRFCSNTKYAVNYQSSSVGWTRSAHAVIFFTKRVGTENVPTLPDCHHAIPLLENKKYEALLADKGYDTDAIVAHATKRGLYASFRRKRAAKPHGYMIKNATRSVTR